MNKTEDLDTEETPDESADAAGRLLNLIDEILGSKDVAHQGKKVLQLNFFQALPIIASLLDYESDTHLQLTFFELTRQVRRDIGTLDLSKENVRKTAIARISDIEKVFSGRNYAETANTVLSKHFNRENRSALENISERLQSQGIQGISESSQKTLNDSIQEAKEIASMLEDSGEVSKRMRKLIHLHLSHLQYILANYSTMGERDFWDSYRILFSSFIELHEVISNEKTDKTKYNEKLRTMLNRLLLVSSHTADAITIAGPTIPLLLP